MADVEPAGVQAEAPKPTPAAGRARRLVYMALEDYYDEAKRGYKPGHSDATIAAECGVGEKCVRDIREESFGPLAVPNELAGLAAELATLKREQTAAHEAAMLAIAGVEQRIEQAKKRNGWQ